MGIIMDILKTKLKGENQKTKENRLLLSGLDLFCQKGINDTSIQEIVDNAGVAKGTFYLYFKDKYHLQRQIATIISREIFSSAMEKLKTEEPLTFEDKLIFIIDDVINQLSTEPILMKFISKDLSLGLYGDGIAKLMDNDEIGIYKTFLEAIKENGVTLKRPYITLMMIVELVSATCFTSITYKEPCPIEEFKPYLYETIKKMLN